MYQRHVTLRGYATKLDDNKLGSLMFTAAMERQLDTLVKKLQAFSKVLLRLQKNLCTLRQTRA